MEDKIEKLREQRILLICESVDSKTQFVKQRIQKRLKRVNVQLYKETKNPIYL